ncbi:hypothetical protein AB0M36_18225 [Actinoplanes sp. NPDC051346]|uniref:hypothetical protein n=1 Tax=Actinoplanes sp. NPDC051346 TaxID=3155048 RepID=UPI00342507F7
MTTTETFALAGFVAGLRWKPPEQAWTRNMPRVVSTVSDCLAELLPADQDRLIESWQQSLHAPWHRSLEHAISAVRHAPPGSDAVHVWSMSVPTAGVVELRTLLEEWIGDLPHPIRVNLSQPTAAPPGTVEGFEVLGFDLGRIHTWLCYGLHEEGRERLGIRPGEGGLLTTLHDAERVADLANSNVGTPEDITWFPALITEHDAKP